MKTAFHRKIRLRNRGPRRILRGGGGITCSVIPPFSKIKSEIERQMDQMD